MRSEHPQTLGGPNGVARAAALNSARQLDQLSQDALANARSAQSAFEQSTNTDEARDALRMAGEAAGEAQDAYEAARKIPGPEVDELADIKSRMAQAIEIHDDIYSALGGF